MFHLRLFLIFFFSLLAPAAAPDPAEQAGNEALKRYFAAASRQQQALREVAMEAEIQAALPRLNKSGTMVALRHISNLGRITYRALTFQGDDTIKKDVIARYMHAEVEASATASLGITPENYKFKYRGLHGSGDWQLHLFELEPRQKRPGLFKGWLWLEAKTALPVREQGELAKSPSVFLRKVEFIRDYEIHDGVAWPVRIDSVIDTRLVGKAELKVRLSKYAKASVLPEKPISARAGRDHLARR